MGNLNLSTDNKPVVRAKTMPQLSEISRGFGVTNHVNYIVLTEIPRKCHFFSTQASHLDEWAMYLSCGEDLKADFLEMILWRESARSENISDGSQINMKCITGQFHQLWKCQQIKKWQKNQGDRSVYHRSLLRYQSTTPRTLTQHQCHACLPHISIQS